MFQLKEITDRIYLLTFDDHYDLCMHFLRYQEFYESPEFKGRNFEIVDMLDWYSRKYGKSTKFTYVDDWAGFNIPGRIIFELNHAIKDFNRYDRFMLSIAEYIKTKAGSDFYLIGTCTEDIDTLDHEVAHGLYYTDEKYRDKMNKIIHSLPPKTQESIYSRLGKAGYHHSVFKDEAQAYLSTGLCKEMDIKSIRKFAPDFEKVFNKYKKKIKKK